MTRETYLFTCLKPTLAVNLTAACADIKPMAALDKKEQDEHAWCNVGNRHNTKRCRNMVRVSDRFGLPEAFWYRRFKEWPASRLVGRFYMLDFWRRQERDKTLDELPSPLAGDIFHLCSDLKKQTKLLPDGAAEGYRTRLGCP